jgi:hypothetical protein
MTRIQDPRRLRPSGITTLLYYKKKEENTKIPKKKIPRYWKNTKMFLLLYNHSWCFIISQDTQKLSGEKLSHYPPNYGYDSQVVSSLQIFQLKLDIYFNIILIYTLMSPKYPFPSGIQTKIWRLSHLPHILRIFLLVLFSMMLLHYR